MNITNKSKLSFIVATALLVSQAAVADTNDFIGKWVNVDSKTGGITQLEITPSGVSDDKLNIQTQGKCHPNDCDWGITDLHLYGANASDDNYQYGKAVYEHGFKESTLTMEYKDDKRLMLNNFDQFYSGNRENYHGYNIFRKVSGHAGCKLPDLIIQSIDRPEFDSGSVIKATIKNIGQSKSGRSIARLMDSSTLQATGAPSNAIAWVPALAPGATYTATFRLDYWIYNPDADFDVTADYKSMVKECKENNNKKEFSEIG